MIINIITLGCSKNLVDSEYILRQFHSNGHQVFHDKKDIEADVIILNTCGFILDAKEESIETILHYAAEKKAGRLEKLIVMGCLSERYMSDLKLEIPEIDHFFGVWDHKEIVQSIGSEYYHNQINNRFVTTPTHYAFLKVSEGCNRQCAFCAIPGIRGPQRSRSVEALLEEARSLAAGGARELILIAQDLTSYGLDLKGKKMLPELLKRLSALNEIDWIRMHYAYPTGFPEEVIDLMAADPKICNYLDIPIQHINSRILVAMNRGHNRNKLEALLNLLREKVPVVAVRTTVMTGFPGETEEEFEELYTFLKTFRFERLGVFPYSHEEDTPAAKFADDVPPDVKQTRADRIMELQQQISLETNRKKIGQIMKVLVDQEEQQYYTGRTEHDSPEVDNEVLISKTSFLKTGEFYRVQITGADEFDLYGEVTGQV